MNVIFAWNLRFKTWVLNTIRHCDAKLEPDALLSRQPDVVRRQQPIGTHEPPPSRKDVNVSDL